MRRIVAATAFAALALSASDGQAQERYRYPSHCHLGCARVSAYRDAAGRVGYKEAGITDWACGGNSYDGHRGTDFAMGRGNAIVAAIGGVVTAARDGVFDGCTSGTCSPGEGNFVEVLDAGGRRVRYLHMRLGSVAVGVGATVACGQKLGEVASSGASTGNHLHFDVRRNGTGVASTYDPFAGPCGSGSSTWTSQGGYNSLPGTECSRPDEDGDGSPRGEDCDDHNPARTPGKAEVCDNIDNNCNGRVDEDVARECGSDVGECKKGSQTCSAGAWGACVGSIDPVPESCDEKDNDCDGTSDEERICEHEEVALGLPVYGDGTHSDINADGRADACALAGPGFQCLLSGTHGFERAIPGPLLEVTSLTPREIVPSMRMGDVDGDGRADLCSRVGDDVVCWKSTGNGFSEQVLVASVGALPSGALGPQVLLGNVGGDAADDVCIRDSAGLRCYVDIGRGSARVLALPALSDAGGYADVIHYGSIRLGDINGDGRADVCARNAEGVSCFLAEGDGFPRRIVGPAWSDAAGWSALGYWSTIRLADVDGDGKKDICGRGPDGFQCHLADGNGFSTVRTGPRMNDADGWKDRAHYTTLRMGDVDGDGKADVCARDRERVFCWLWTGSDFGRELAGPAFSDADGFSLPTAYRSFRLGDIDRDGSADVCARNKDGLRCYTSAGGRPLDRLWTATAWNDEGLSSPWAQMSIRLAGGGARSTGGARGVEGPEAGGCGCATAPRTGSWSLAFIGVAIAVIRAGRRRRLAPAGSPPQAR